MFVNIYAHKYHISELTREKEWDNIVACHKNVPFATTWSFDKAKMGEYKLIHKRFKENAKNIVALVSNVVIVDSHLPYGRIFLVRSPKRMWKFCRNWLQYRPYRSL